MSRSDHSRRAVLKSAGLGMSAALLPGLAPAVAAENAEIWAHEYWANKDGAKLNLRRKSADQAAVKNARNASVVSFGASSDR